MLTTAGALSCTAGARVPTASGSDPMPLVSSASGWAIAAGSTGRAAAAVPVSAGVADCVGVAAGAVGCARSGQMRSRISAMSTPPSTEPLRKITDCRRGVCMQVGGGGLAQAVVYNAGLAGLLGFTNLRGIPASTTQARSSEILMSDSTVSALPMPEVDKDRRGFLTFATTATGVVGAAFATVPFIASWAPSERARAAGAPVTVDLTKIEPGQMVTYVYRKKPMYVVRRTPEMLARLAGHEGELKDA